VHTVTSPDPHLPPDLREAPARSRGFFARFLLHCLSLAVAAGAFVAYQHFKLHGQPTAGLVALVAAGLFAFSPVRALIGEFFAIEGKALHLAHGLGGLALVGLGATGVISGTSLLSHAAMAPFAMMGAAQALMHSDHPRNAQQAAAIRQFATSLPEVAQFTQSKDLTSPANAARAVSVLSDLIGKAEVLGGTELKADPKFQSAWAQASTRTGLTLGMDSIDKAIDRLAQNPQTAAAVPELKRRLAQARSIAKASAQPR
jgi:hypothetical protein